MQPKVDRKWGIKISIGQRITELRKEKNISQNQLAKALSVSRQAVSKWENDLSSPDSLKMIILAEVLDTDVEYLTTGRQVVTSRPPVVLTTVETVEVEKVVEKPVVQVVEKIVERKVEVPVEFPVVEYVEKPVIKRVVRTRYMRNPVEYALVGICAFVLGLLVGLVF